MRFWPKRLWQVGIYLGLVLGVGARALFGVAAQFVVIGAWVGFNVGQADGYSDGMKHGRAIWEWSFLKRCEESAVEQYAPGHPAREQLAAEMAEVAKRLPSKRFAR